MNKFVIFFILVCFNLIVNSSSAQENLFLKGFDCLEQEDYGCAVQYFERAHQLEPSDSVDFHLALAHYLNDSLDLSINLLLSMIETDTNNLEPVLLLSEIYEEKEDYGQASRALTKYIEKNPFNCEAYVARAKITLNYWELDKFVADDLESALFFCDDSTVVEVLLMLGEVYFQLGAFEKAKNVYDEVLALAPDDSAVMYDVASYLAEVGDYHKAIDLFNNYHKTFHDADVYFQLGYCYLATDMFEASAQNFTEYIRHDSMDAEAWYNRGIAYAADSKYDFAIRDLQEAYRLDGTMIEAMFNLGLVYQNKGIYDQAIKTYGIYIIEVNDDPEAYYNRGLSKYYSDDEHGACADWIRMKELGSKDLWKEVKTLCPDY